MLSVRNARMAVFFAGFSERLYDGAPQCRLCRGRRASRRTRRRSKFFGTTALIWIKKPLRSLVRYLKTS